MIDQILNMKGEIEELKSVVLNQFQIGPVEEIDAEKGYRLKLGEDDDGPYLSPWIPHPEDGKSSVPLKKGQIVGVPKVGGDARQALMIRGGYSDDLPSPNSNMNANVFEDAGVRIELVDGALLITIDGVSFELSGDGFKQTGGKQEHDGKNVGSTHDHGGIMRGNADTDPPNA